MLTVTIGWWVGFLAGLSLPATLGLLPNLVWITVQWSRIVHLEAVDRGLVDDF